MTTEAKTTEPGFAWAVPSELAIPIDPLRCRLDFHHQATILTLFSGETAQRKVVSMADVVHALAEDLSFGTGLLPQNTLWWQNTRGGPVVAVYIEPQIRKLALLRDVTSPPERFEVPLPGFIFLCSQGRPPWLYAVKKKPTKETDTIYKAPLCNVHDNGMSCGGDHKYPPLLSDIPHSFFVSFFSPTLAGGGKSVKYPRNVTDLWKDLDKRRRFPLADLVEHGTVKDLMNMGDNQ